jgi:hypothetical protein
VSPGDILVIRHRREHDLVIFRDVLDQLKQGKILFPKNFVRCTTACGAHQAFSEVHELRGELVFLMPQDAEADGGNDQADE